MNRKQRIVFAALFAMLCILFGCAGGGSADTASNTEATQGSTEGEAVGEDAASQSGQVTDDAESNVSDAEDNASEELSDIVFPTGWLVAEYDGVSSGTPIQVLYLPDMDVVGHRDGKPIAEEEMDELRATWPASYEGAAVVEYMDNVHVVDPSYVMVDLADVLPDAEYDIVYSYASTSACAGNAIPGITGEQISGYVNGRQFDEYLGEEQFAVPCAYWTALKVMNAARELENNGYKLLVYDVYRPMRAQMQLSDAFVQAYNADEAIRVGIGSWSTDWFVASGSSGHNYGTDIDVGLCNENGEKIPMPSEFDAFDDSGRLTSYPMDAASIDESAYCEAVAGNEACVALHRAFVAAGFTELASEWWHFADEETEVASRAIVGDGGLDFVAELDDGAAAEEG